MGRFTSPEDVLREEYGIFVDGGTVAPTDRDRFETVDPSTEEVLVDVCLGTNEDVDRAVESARRALDNWRETPAIERGEILRQIADRIRNHSETLTVIEALDSGKP